MAIKTMSKFNSDIQIGDITDVYERLKSIPIKFDNRYRNSN